MLNYGDRTYILKISQELIGGFRDADPCEIVGLYAVFYRVGEDYDD